MNEIFISYRREDDPGYVARLADSLNQRFGEGSVYRDVDSERAGGKWKQSIARSVSGAEVVLAVMGPKWQELLHARTDIDNDWTRFELNQANTLGIPVIPTLLSRTELDFKQGFADLSWLGDRQFFELSDGQGRWDTDLDRLVQEICALTRLEAVSSEVADGQSLSQASSGDQSPNINTGGGDVSISFGDTKGGG